MDVGLLLDLRNPPPWRTDYKRLYGFTLELCEEAERLGADSIWVSEHHQFADGYCPQPLTFLAAAAARTKRVRLGTGILLSPLRSAPLIAEEAAMVDIISGGRLELGLGAGVPGAAQEFGLFGADFEKRFSTNDSRARELRRIWAEGRVTPPPVQDRVPIWMGYQAERGARRAGLMGERLLCPNARLWPAYRDGLIEGGHDPAIGQMGGLIQGWISEDPEADWPVLARHLSYQLEGYQRFGREDVALPPIDTEQVRAAPIDAGLGAFLLAPPEDAARRIKAFVKGAPVRQIYFWASLTATPEHMSIKHVETIFTKLAPLLKPYDPLSERIGA